MAVYWLSFRIEDDSTYEERYNNLALIIQKHARMFWEDTTSFVVFDSASDLESLAAALKRAIAPAKDVFLIRTMDTKSAYICGKNRDQDIFKLMPYLKKI